MVWLLLAIQIVLSSLLLIAATSKVLRTDDFLGALRLSPLPQTLFAPIAVAIPLAEYALSFFLIVSTPTLLRVSFLLIAALFAMFALWMGWVLTQGLHPKCGCFGSSRSTVSRQSIARNIVFLAIAVVGALLSLQVKSSIPDPSIWMALATISAGLAGALLVGFQLARPSLNLKRRQMEQVAMDG